MTAPTVDERFRQAATKCREDGVPIDTQPGGAIHRWVVENVSLRPGTEFFIVMGIAAEMADMDAQAEGQENQFDRAIKRSRKKQ